MIFLCVIGIVLNAMIILLVQKRAYKKGRKDEALTQRPDNVSERSRYWWFCSR